MAHWIDRTYKHIQIFRTWKSMHISFFSFFLFQGKKSMHNHLNLSGFWASTEVYNMGNINQAKVWHLFFFLLLLFFCVKSQGSWNHLQIGEVLFKYRSVLMWLRTRWMPKLLGYLYIFSMIAFEWLVAFYSNIDINIG